jgi:hypothetical protein
VKLPLWRLIAGVSILAALASVLVLLAPVYLANYRFQRLVTGLMASPETSDWDETRFRQRVTAEARELALPVAPGEVVLSQSGGHTRLEIHYPVRRDFGLYQVDLHFHASAHR